MQQHGLTLTLGIGDDLEVDDEWKRVVEVTVALDPEEFGSRDELESLEDGKRLGLREVIAYLYKFAEQLVVQGVDDALNDVAKKYVPVDPWTSRSIARGEPSPP